MILDDIYKPVTDKEIEKIIKSCCIVRRFILSVRNFRAAVPFESIFTVCLANRRETVSLPVNEETTDVFGRAASIYVNY